MRINKTYLKLGVAFTATFGFGFFVGTVYQQWKTKKALKKSADEFKQFVKEGMGVEATIPEEPLEEVEEEKEVEEMPRRKERSPEEVQTIIKDDAIQTAKERISQFPMSRIDNDDVGQWADFVDDILKNYNGEDFLVEDITPWGCSQQKPIACVIFSRKDREFYWNDRSFIHDSFDKWEMRLIMLAFFCFATYRQDNDGTRYYYTATCEENIFAAEPLMRHEDHVYTRDIRILYFPTLDKEVHIHAIPKYDMEDINVTLDNDINYNGGFDYSEEDL